MIKNCNILQNEWPKIHSETNTRLLSPAFPLPKIQLKIKGEPQVIIVMKIAGSSLTLYCYNSGSTQFF